MILSYKGTRVRILGADILAWDPAMGRYSMLHNFSTQDERMIRQEAEKIARRFR